MQKIILLWIIAFSAVTFAKTNRASWDHLRPITVKINCNQHHDNPYSCREQRGCLYVKQTGKCIQTITVSRNSCGKFNANPRQCKYNPKCNYNWKQGLCMVAKPVNQIVCSRYKTAYQCHRWYSCSWDYERNRCVRS
ncbi:MAG: hypothetical protein ISR65_07530 [Bacteriovoracaceae bacterium]|nr:hypothetical protein [Bacteriovoracaceae bacterium]